MLRTHTFTKTLRFSIANMFKIEEQRSARIAANTFSLFSIKLGRASPWSLMKNSYIPWKTNKLQIFTLLLKLLLKCWIVLNAHPGSATNWLQSWDYSSSRNHVGIINLFGEKNFIFSATPYMYTTLENSLSTKKNKKNLNIPAGAFKTLHKNIHFEYTFTNRTSQ